MKQALYAIALLLAAGSASAHPLQHGRPAPPAVLEQIKDAPATRIGSQSVRALPPSAVMAGKQANGAAPAQEGRTLVVRDGDNLVGVSANELVIVSPALDAIAAKIASLHLPGAQIHTAPKLQLLVVKTARFEQLEMIRGQVAAAFPEARFDLPVTYFPHKPR
ncbi:MAG: hypothetical protein WA924_01785 [Burkholderiaceae bacterium]